MAVEAFNLRLKTEKQQQLKVAMTYKHLKDPFR